MTGRGASGTDPVALSRVIFDYAGQLARAPDRDVLIDIISNMGRDLVGADRCTIWLTDDSRQQLVARFAHGATLIPIGAGQGFVGHCVATGEVVLCNTPAADPRFASVMDAHTGYQTQNVLTVPMRAAGGEIMGAFQAVNKPDGFQAADADLLALAAAYSARTIETQMLLRKAATARQLARELEIARDFQQLLLAGSHAHSTGRIEFAAVCQAALDVGGDYYDLMPLPGDRVAFAIGDVSGKGIAAALMMASVQASLHAAILQDFSRLADVVTGLNSTVLSAATGKYSTLFIALYDPHASSLTTVNAGHCQPWVRHAGATHRLDVGGPPIGLLANARYEQQTTVLAPGDLVIGYSDGLTEAENAAGQFWEEQGLDDVLGRADGTAEAVVNQLMQAAAAFAGDTPQRDDMTAICVRVIA